MRFVAFRIRSCKTEQPVTNDCIWALIYIFFPASTLASSICLQIASHCKLVAYKQALKLFTNIE